MTRARPPAWPGALLRWYDSHRRVLPWREDPTPYRVWVSEMMLQQTRVETVIPYFDRFLARFPDIRTLAQADPQDVLKHWEGLGYYRRARLLHRAAQVVVADHGGTMPGDFATLRTLPGIGPYCAAAIASIAFGEAVPVVDGNVVRVAARLWMLDGDAASVPFRRDVFDRLKAHVPAQRAGDFNQALMELGALVCTPRTPDCPACPVRRHCAARAAGAIEDYPRRATKAPVPEHRIVVAVIRRRARWLVLQRPAEGLLGGLWEFPGGRVAPGESDVAALTRKVRAETGLRVAGAETRPALAHAFSHFKIDVHPFRCSVAPGRIDRTRTPSLRWVTAAELAALPMARITRRVADATTQR